MKKIFQKTKEWNGRMGSKTPETFTDLPTEERELAFDLMVEETTEFFEAKDKNEALDAAADMLFVAFGNFAKAGLSYEEVESYLKKVVKSNESKFADTEEQAILSIDKEARRLNISPNDISYKEIDGKFVIFNKISGKILKSVLYLSPEQID